LQISIPESCKLKFPVIATKYIKSCLTPPVASTAGIFIALALKQTYEITHLTQTKNSRQNLSISAGAIT